MDRAPRILVVDEDPDHLNILATLLRHHEYAVTVEPTPDDGVAAALRERPDAILTGLHFDGRAEGLGLIDRLREQTETASTPIVVVSSFTDMHDDELRARGVRCVQKGGHLANIIELLEMLLQDD